MWGVGRDEHALGWTRAGEVLRVEGREEPLLPPGSVGPPGWQNTFPPWWHMPHALIVLAVFFPVLIQLLLSCSYLGWKLSPGCQKTFPPAGGSTGLGWGLR